MQRFHLIISALLHQYLEPIAEQLSLSVSQLISLFVELAVNQIDFLYQEYGRQMNNIYELVDVEGRRDVNINLPQDIYMQIKWLQGYHNLYSMAQVVRRCIFLMLILMQIYGGLRGAMAALDRLNQATQTQQESKDEHGVMHQFLGLVHLIGGFYLFYGAIVEYILFMLFYLYPPPRIEE